MTNSAICGMQGIPRKTQVQLCGLLFVTGAALLFGVVAAFVKAARLPSLVLQLCRSVIEWALGVACALVYQRIHLTQPRIPMHETAPLCSSASSHEEASKTELVQLLFGPPHLRGWIVARAFLYWCFLACWWSALHVMPIGDATAIVYTAPLFTIVYAYLLLGEEFDWSFYPVLAFDGLGLLLICRPTFLFPVDSSSLSPDEGNYWRGALTALCSAIVSGVLPICTRKSKECAWTAITHTSSLLSAVVFTPTAMFVWGLIDPNANAAISHAVYQLFGLWPGQGSGQILSETHHLTKWLLVLGCTFTGYIALALQTVGYQMEEAGRASVMNVLEIPFSFVLQVAFFGEMVSPLDIAGATLIVAGTALNVVRRIQKS